jgi:glycosyltransferase involved in cell wall biosynthesis
MATSKQQTSTLASRPSLVSESRPTTLPAIQAGSPGKPARSTAAPSVSVILPTYNRAHLLNDALDSIAAQTYRDYEVIIIDDGSDDQTRELVARRKESIRYHWQPNQGVAEARNHALRLTHSEFVAFLDSDDLWEPTFLEQAVQRLRQHPDEALVYTDFVSTDATGKPRRGHRKQPAGGEVTPTLFASTFIHTSAVVARAHIIRDAGGFDGRLTHNEDYDLWLRLSLRHRFGLIAQPLCRRRCHPGSLSRAGCQPETLLAKAELLHHFFEYGGGKNRIESGAARRRLGKLYYTAGKRFLKARRPQEALPLFRRAINLHPARIRAYAWYLFAEMITLWPQPSTHHPQTNR